MGRRPAYPPLDVRMNGRLVGMLRKDPSGAISFRYDPSWIGWDQAIPISSSMSLREERYVGAVPHAFFENLLPDERTVRAALAARVQAEGTDAFDLLSAIGRDCIGALQFLPGSSDPGSVGTVDGRELDEAEIASLIRGLEKAPLGAGADPEFRISLAGAQEKTALLCQHSRWLIPHGSTATTHILKPTIGKRRGGLDLSHSVENEYLCLRMLRAFGLPVASAEMASFEDQRVLVVERFDRRWMPDGRLLRLPQEDLCQALGYPVSKKYESDGGPGMPAILAHLRASDDPEEDRLLFLKAQILFWALGATDGHAKNFSQFLRPGGRFVLTPLYDVMSAQPNVDAGEIPHNRFKLAMAVGSSRHYVVGRIAARHFIETSRQCGLSEQQSNAAFDEMADNAEQVITAVSDTLPSAFPEAILAAVTKGVRHRLKS